ncbi:hypothetical protein DYB32_002287 [Aphanomyces invadans]|uniref:RING-type domain-containing protein n=1 Tax=Aphanomyces invadans TaxID=157072 RepID=A0A3R7ACW2_9STRA|nr:hypothetical protein DYB32_002287 [Aphanomyces invadans]
MSEEEADCCPLCMEELDLTDKTFDACRCGYQVCLWCWHQIKNEYNGLCPACRAPYSELAKSKGNVDREEYVAATVPRRKQKEKIEKKAVAPPKAAPINRKSLVNVRVMQRNLVYVIGLPVHYADEEYCNFFLRNLSCNNPECLYLHELGETDDSFTKEEMQTAGKGCFREIGLYEDRRGNAFPHLTPAMREAQVVDGKAPQARPTAVASDAQRKAQSAAAISKLKLHTEQDSKPRPKQHDYAAAPAPVPTTAPTSSTSPSSPHITQTEAQTKPVLYVDTSSTGKALPPATSPTADEPLWAQSFPRVTQASNEPSQRPIHHVFSPFGMGFDGGIGRVHQQQPPLQPPQHHSAPPPPPSSGDKTAHVSAWSFDPLFSDSRQAPVSPPHPSPPVFEFAAVDSAFTPRNESSEALAGLLGVQLSAKPLLTGSMMPPPTSAIAPPTSGGKRGSRFSFANAGGNEPAPSSQPSPVMEDYNPFGGMYRSPEKMFDGAGSATSSSGAFALSMGPPDASLSGMAFLQQMLPNVNISYGREPTEQHMHRPAYTHSFEQKSSWTNGLDSSRPDNPFWSQGSSLDAPPPSSYAFHDPAIVHGGGSVFGGSAFYQDDAAVQQQKKPFGRSFAASPQHHMNTGRS